MGIENFEPTNKHDSGYEEEKFLVLTKWRKWEIEGCNKWIREVLNQIGRYPKN